jgi:hypothetical protein
MISVELDGIAIRRVRKEILPGTVFKKKKWEALLSFRHSYLMSGLASAGGCQRRIKG